MLYCPPLKRVMKLNCKSRMVSNVASKLLSAVTCKIAFIGILAASIAGAGAANYSTTKVGTVNGNSLSFTAATGNSDSDTTLTGQLCNQRSPRVG